MLQIAQQISERRFFFCLQLTSAGFTLSEKWKPEWYYWRWGSVVCWLLAASCPIQAWVLVLALPPRCGRGSQVWCHDAGLARPRVRCTDFHALGWRSGNQWRIGQIIENLGAHLTPTTAPLRVFCFFCWLQWEKSFQNVVWFRSVSAWLSVATCFAVCKDPGAT